ncbi:hypothetical protein [Paenibacillus pini]|uniref:Uncharacterized protein n=1 Tax=Paenibacillus pini JCM 16418 TaxID=1236976 RepID=W7Z1C2_9BACL|nr:hypothetical protein [Paenibacillus pini]GAF10791.1 hypothetical protein JCM16418_5012 [Paenibacillus pini JCM 16418]
MNIKKKVEEIARNMTNSLISVGNLFLASLVFMKVWNWFPSQIFNVTEINYVESFGLILLLFFFQNTMIDSEKIENESTQVKLTNNFISTVLYLYIWGSAAIVHLFM